MIASDVSFGCFLTMPADETKTESKIAEPRGASIPLSHDEEDEE
jgi:hypothetical protein